MRRLTFILILAASFSTPLLAQSISAELPVSATLLTAADSWQATPAVATNGDGFLVAWQNRNPEGGVFAARVSRDGTLLDQTPIPVAVPSRRGERPQVAWTGQLFIVLWLSGRDIRATTISREGEIVREQSIGEQSFGGRDPSVACTTARCLVAWSVGITSQSQVAAKFLDSNGNPLSQFFLPHMFIGGQVGAVRTASNGRNFLVAWQQSEAPRSRIYTAAVGLDGHVDPVQQITVLDFYLGEHAVASDGSTYLLTWGVFGMRVEAQRFDEDGKPTGALKVLHASGELIGLVNLIRAGSGYLVFIKGPGLLAFRVTVDGTPIDPAPALLTGDIGSSDRIAVANNGVRTLVAWPRVPAPNAQTDIYGAFVDAQPAAIQASFLVSQSAAPQFSPALATDGERMLTVWSEASSPATSQIRTTTFLPNGLRGGIRTIHPSAVDQFQPVVAFNGSEYLVAWREGVRNATTATVKAKRLNRFGEPIDASEIVLTSSGCGFFTNTLNNSVAAASDGHDFVVAWQECSSTAGRLFVTRVSDGAPDEPQLVAVANNPNRLDLGGVAWGSEHYLLTWIEVKPVPFICDGVCVTARVQATRLSRAAASLDAQPLQLSPESALPFLTRVAWDGTQFVAFWSQSQNISAARVSPYGAISSPVAAITGRSFVSALAATFDGASVGVTWMDQESSAPLTMRGDIWMSRVAFGGGPSSLPFLVAGSADDELAPAIAAFGAGTFALAYQRVAHEREYGSANRVFLRLISGCPAVTINSISANVEVLEGTTVTLTATVTGATAFQWYRGASGTTTLPVAGMTTASINVTPAVTTGYWVRASNGCGSFADSPAVTVTVRLCQPPSITVQPRDAVVAVGRSAVLSVAATGTLLTYQWYEGIERDLTHPVGGNSPTLTTGPITATTHFWVRIIGRCGSVVSSEVAKVSLAAKRRAVSQ